jgi:hypothetical protein
MKLSRRERKVLRAAVNGEAIADECECGCVTRQAGVRISWALLCRLQNGGYLSSAGLSYHATDQGRRALEGR